MNLNCVLINQNRIPEHLFISGIDHQGYLCLYNKTKGFDAKKFLNAVSASLLERNVFVGKKYPDALKNGSQWVRRSEEYGRCESLISHVNQLLQSHRDRALSLIKIGPRRLTSAHCI